MEKLIRDGLAAVVPKSRTCKDTTEFTMLIMEKYNEETLEFQNALADLSECENEAEHIEAYNHVFSEAGDILQVITTICSKYTGLSEKTCLRFVVEALEEKADKLGTFKSQTIMQKTDKSAPSEELH